jgi:predicted GNAT family N-acyltransferase
MDSSSNVPVGEKVIIKQVVNEPEKQDALAVRKIVFVEEQKVPVEIEIDEFDEDSSTIHFVGYYNGEPVAASRLRRYAKNIGKAERVAVLATVRMLGIGAMLMERMEQIAQGLGFQKIKLNAQLQAVPFYARLGYIEHGNTFMDAGIEHIAMEKELG